MENHNDSTPNKNNEQSQSGISIPIPMVTKIQCESMIIEDTQSITNSYDNTK